MEQLIMRGLKIYDAQIKLTMRIVNWKEIYNIKGIQAYIYMLEFPGHFIKMVNSKT
jgi:hypothetical protein